MYTCRSEAWCPCDPGLQMVEEPFKLLIIDSIMGLLRSDFTGRGELAERQVVLNQMLAKVSEKVAYHPSRLGHARSFPQTAVHGD